MEVSDKKLRNSFRVFFSFILSHTYLCLYWLLAKKVRNIYLALSGTLNTKICGCKYISIARRASQKYIF